MQILGTKQSDMDKACETQRDEWIKQFATLFPDKLCNNQIGALSCSTTQPLYCPNSNRLQDCSDSDKNTIYGGNVPNKLYTDLMNYLETDYKCTGYCGKCRGKKLYSDCANTDSSGKSCNEAFTDLIKKQATIVGTISGICAVLGILVILSLFCLCYRGDFAKSENLFYFCDNI